MATWYGRSRRILSLGPVALSAHGGVSRLIGRGKTAGVVGVGLSHRARIGIWFGEATMESYRVSFTQIDQLYQSRILVSEQATDLNRRIVAGALRIGWLMQWRGV